MIVEANVIHITSERVIYEFPSDYPADLKKNISAIYFDSSKKLGFPEDACWWTSSRIQSLGLERSSGLFALDFPIIRERGIMEYHNWNTDSRQRVLDLTLSQMNPGLVIKLENAVVIVDPNTDFYKRFIPLKTDFHWEK